MNDTGLLDPENNTDVYVQKIEMPEVWEMKMLQQNRDFVRLIMEGTWKKNSSSVKNGFVRVEVHYWDCVLSILTQFMYCHTVNYFCSSWKHIGVWTIAQTCHIYSIHLMPPKLK